MIVKIEYLNFSSSYSINKIKKLKKNFFSSSNLSPPSLPLYFPTTLYITVKLLSSFPLSYILTLFSSILFCINLISFIPFDPYFFPHKNCEYSLSLSLYCLIFVHSYNSNLGWWFFNLIFCVVVFKFPTIHHSYGFGWIF